jgi:hypothetical protein
LASQVVKFDRERVIPRRVYEFNNAKSRDDGVVFTINTFDIVAPDIENGLVAMATRVTTQPKMEDGPPTRRVSSSI